MKIGYFHFLRGWFRLIYSLNFSNFDLANSKCRPKSVGMHLIFFAPNLYDHVRYWLENRRGCQVKIGNFHFLRGWFWAIFGWNSRFFNLQNSRSLLKLVGCISFSSHQTYTTMYEVEGKTEEDIKWILDIFIFLGGDFGEFSAEISAFSTFRTRDIC